MKYIFKTFGIPLALLMGVTATNAQNPLMPQASSGQMIVQDFGLGKVTLNYSRPNVKGRLIFGDLEPYGEVWRTGANNATNITFTDEVMMDGHPVPAGTYALFTIPGKIEWTVILNKTAKQWGAYNYKKEDDLFRFAVKPIPLKDKIETFTMSFADVTEGSMSLQIMWENTLLTIPLTIDDDAKVTANIEKAMLGEKKPYFAAAQYYYENNKDMQQALKWITEAEKTDMKAPYYKLWKARIQLKMGDKKAAAATASEGIKLAKESNNDEYVRLNEAVLSAAK